MSYHPKYQIATRELATMYGAVNRFRDVIDGLTPVDMRDVERIGVAKGALSSIEHSIETVSISLGRLQTASFGPAP